MRRHNCRNERKFCNYCIKIHLVEYFVTVVPVAQILNPALSYLNECGGQETCEGMVIKIVLILQTFYKNKTVCSPRTVNKAVLSLHDPETHCPPPSLLSLADAMRLLKLGTKIKTRDAQVRDVGTCVVLDQEIVRVWMKYTGPSFELVRL